jgi:bifunctional non-homologous end joining protein LigD
VATRRVARGVSWDEGDVKKLERYRQKRNFAVTPEPPPRARAKGSPRFLRFMVHKHDATHLHYDLRLEIDGALASWAIPKGPSYDPREKRLAIETEDHPLAYGDFEGRIPEGEYGAGDSIIWDRGVYETVPPGQASQMRKKGHLDVLLVGEKLQGRWHLVRTRRTGQKQQWICFKANDEHAASDRDIVAERPESVQSGKRVTRGPERKGKLQIKQKRPEECVREEPGVRPPSAGVESASASARRGRPASRPGRAPGPARRRAAARRAGGSRARPPAT